MQRLSLLAMLGVLAVAAGCESGSSEGPPAIRFDPGAPPAGAGFVALYAPPVDVGPYPNDIYNLPGQTLSVPEKFTSPLAEALNTLDGFSTTAHISAPFNAPVDPASVVPFHPAQPTGTETLFVLDATAGAPLVPNVHYAVRISGAAGSGGAILEIQPLRPLMPDNTYAFILTSGIRSMAGVAAGPDQVFRLVRDAHLAGVMTGNPGLDALLPAIGPLVDAGVNLLGLPGAAIVSAWSVSTQSTGDVLEYLNQTATAQVAVVAPTGSTTADLGLGLPGIADLYAGFLEIPYFGDPTEPLASVWVNASFVPLTRDDPVPLRQGGIQRIPVLASLPNAASMQTKPADGWPLVVLQHGVTVNRLVMVTIADAFAQAGFGVIAIDLPLHGVTDASSPFFQAPGNAFGIAERHFYFDNVGVLGDFTPDGEIDDGWQIFNLENPLNARDHGRQAVSDLIHLLRTLPTMNFDGNAQTTDVDADRLHFVSLSLGSIFSTGLLAVNTDFGSATMSSPAALFTDFLYAPAALVFGLPIRTAIEAQGLAFGTVAFDNFARDLQTVLDPIEPLNYAAAAALNHPLHVVEVLSDTSVPASLTEKVAARMGLVTVSSTTTNAGGVRGIVRFTAGGHSSMFNPQIDLAVTREMQAQAVTFAATAGTTITIANSGVVQ